MIRRVLLIDDDMDDIDVFKTIMLSIDSLIDVLCLQQPKSMESVISTSRPDLIFLDLMMPDIDGIECLTKLKANKSTRNIPVILYTGSQNRTEKNLALRIGAFEVIAKGSNILNITSSIKQSISFLNSQP
jgi:PleD family two-component response regulator